MGNGSKGGERERETQLRRRNRKADSTLWDSKPVEIDREIQKKKARRKKKLARTFDEKHRVLLRISPTFFGRNLSEMFHVGFVSHQHQDDLGVASSVDHVHAIRDFGQPTIEVFEGYLRRQVVHEYSPRDSPVVLLGHGVESFLSRRVPQLRGQRFSLRSHDARVVLHSDGRFGVREELVRYIAVEEIRLSDAAVSYQDDLVQEAGALPFRSACPRHLRGGGGGGGGNPKRGMVWGAGE